ncbi:MAG: dihydroorotate dehydrogenase-like protein [Spirochaetales bacterium]|nr:dihydroorotate dehydrogenase-like protein [Spirochaetales bacterium]
MVNLAASYLGLNLINPIIVASSRLTSQLDGLKKSEDAGAGAVVLKSIFEEQIESDSNSMIKGMDDFAVHADAYDFFTNSSKDYYIDRYLELVEQAKKALSIPVIASINCLRPGSWLEYAHRFQEIGADALEMNMFILPSNSVETGREIEQKYIDLIKNLKNRLVIPLALKLGTYFSGMANFMKQLDDSGISGLVLFNRYYKTDIDIENLNFRAGKIISVKEESAVPLQWTALMSGELSCDICGNTGIYSGETIIKFLLAGASAIQICSSIMTEGYTVIGKMKETIENWMESKNYTSINDFSGILCQETHDDPEIWERSQYVKAVCGIS